MSKLCNKSDAISEYAESCVEDMDLSSLMDIVYEGIYHSLDKQTDDEIIEEISNSAYDYIELEVTDCD